MIAARSPENWACLVVIRGEGKFFAEVSGGVLHEALPAFWPRLGFVLVGGSHVVWLGPGFGLGVWFYRRKTR